MNSIEQFFTKGKRRFSQIGSILRNEYRRLRRAHPFSHEWLYSHYISMEAPIVIGGAGRSGTTLMSVMLNAHPDIYCGPEYGLLARDGFSVSGTAANLDVALKALERAVGDSGNRWQFLERAIRLAKQRHAVSQIATKNPTYVFDIPVIFDVFPNAQFVSMCRDGRDVAVSMREHQERIGLRYDVSYDESGRLSMAYCAENWRTFVNAYRAWEGDSRCCLIRYEELVREPERTLRELCGFLAIEFDERMLAFNEFGIGERADVKRPHHTGLSKPLYTNKVGRWHEALTPKQARTFEQFAGEELQYLGYP